MDYLKQKGTKAILNEVRKIQKLAHPDWAFECPQRIREHAISDACAAVKNAKWKAKQTGEPQEVHHRKRKEPTQRFGFDQKSLDLESVFRGKNKVKFYATEVVEKDLEGTEITCENGRWFLVIPRIVRVKVPENQRLDSVALDPGVRSFMSYYAPECHGKIASSDFNRIYRLCLGLDKIYSKLSKADVRGRKRLKKASQRLRWKIKDLVDDLHKKTAYFLVSRFDKVYIPAFETSEMVTKLHSKVARSMLTFAHYRFQQFLKSKAEEYSCQVIDTNEAYTSRTCSYCGAVHKIGSKKIMKCSCGHFDRDLNGARGIYLRALRATSVASKDALHIAAVGNNS